MASRKPLVVINGQLQELPNGDTINASVNEVDVISKTNDNAGALTVGMAVYIKATGSVDKARANAAGTTKVIGLVRDASIAAAGTGAIQTDGILSSSDWTDVTGTTNLTAGSIYYLSDSTAGEITTTAPTAAGSFVVAVGVAVSTTELNIDTDRSSILLA